MPDGFALAALSHALRFRVEGMIREHDAAVTGQFELVTRAPEVLSAALGRSFPELPPYSRMSGSPHSR